MILKYKSASIIAIFVALVLGNIAPVYSIVNHTTHDASMSNMSMHMSMPNQQNANIKEHGVSFSSSPKSYAEQIMASCQDDDEHCPMMALDELNKTASRQMVLDTYLDLVQLYDKNNYSCHHAGHHLGMWLYDYTGNLKDALSHATILCGGSVYHGIFQSYFVGDQIAHNVDKNQIMITQLCPISQENVTWLHERDCVHGIGHGLVRLYNYNTTSAVYRCNEFNTVWAQSACSRGVFMENNDYFWDSGKGDFDKNDVYYPCNKVAEKFASQCYYYYPEHALDKMNLTIEHNIPATFAQCDNISPSKFAKYCYQGIGRLLEFIAFENPEQAVSDCYSGNLAIYHNDCLIGTLKTMLKGDENAMDGFKLCSHSKPDFKTTCYGIIGTWIKTFLYPTKQELESECAKIPEINHISNCINANTALSEVPMFEPV